MAASYQRGSLEDGCPEENKGDYREKSDVKEVRTDQQTTKESLTSFLQKCILNPNELSAVGLTKTCLCCGYTKYHVCIVWVKLYWWREKRMQIGKILEKKEESKFILSLLFTILNPSLKEMCYHCHYHYSVCLMASKL